MAELAGVHVTDASGNLLTDASAAYITDQNIQVGVTAGNILYAANQPEPPGWGDLVDLFSNAVMVAQIKNAIDDMYPAIMWLDTFINASGGTLLYDVKDHWATVLANITAIPTEHTSILDAIAGIAIPEGGLTVEEHNALMALGNVDYDQIASAVWGYNVTLPDMLVQDDGPMMETVVVNQAQYLQFLAGYVGLPVPDRAHFNYIGKDLWSIVIALGYWTNQAESDWIPELDLSLVQQGDTVWSFLNREYAEYTWLLSAPGSWPVGNRVYLQQGVSNAYAVCTLTDADIHAAVAGNLITEVTVNVEARTPPLWPGLANVTLGDAVELVDQMVLDGPMHGVLVSVTTPPTKTGRYNVGGEVYDYGVGMISFDTDNGFLEPWQYLGFRTAVFVPKAMEQADHAYFRVLAGAGGTVRPWLKTATP